MMPRHLIEALPREDGGVMYRFTGDGERTRYFSTRDEAVAFARWTYARDVPVIEFTDRMEVCS